MLTKGRVIKGTAIVVVALAVIVAALLAWNAQRAAAADAETCEKGACAACAEPASCCADAEDVHEELNDV